jgi:serine/threonine protein kinase
MEYAKGQSLDDLLQKDGPIDEAQTKEILFPILDGLKRVHEQGFLHRDIKPGNIIIRDEGGAVLIDFGAARQAIETKSRAITSIVTEGYAPLEQYDGMGNQGPWTDIYALGAVAYKCMTGNKPPSATLRVRSDPLVPLAIATNGKASTTFAAAIEAALNIYENLRPQSIADFSAMIAGTMPVPQPTIADEAARVMSAEPATQIVRPSTNSYSPSGIPGAKSAPASVSVAAPPPLAATPVPVAAASVAPKRSNTAVYLGVAAVIALTIGIAWYVQNGSAPQVTAAEPARTEPPAVATQVTPSTPDVAAPSTAPPSSPGSVASLAPAPAPVMTGPPVPAAPEAAPPSAPAPQAKAPGPPSAPPPAPAQPAATAKASPSPPQPVVAPAPAPPPPPAIRTSFDCAMPGNAAERIVCSDGQLAALDVRVAQMYQQGLRSVSDPNAFRGEQQVWLSQRDGCNDKSCLAASYDERIKELERWIGP